MIWRIVGHLTLLYITFGVVAVVSNVLGDVSILPQDIDWAMVPDKAVVWLWLDRVNPIPLLTALALLAPFGFYPRQPSRNAQVLLGVYALTTLPVSITLVVARVAMCSLRTVPTGYGIALYYWSDVIETIITYLIVSFPAILALVRLYTIRRKSNTDQLCPTCRYDLRGNPDAVTCPECGEVVTRAAGA